MTASDHVDATKGKTHIDREIYTLKMLGCDDKTISGLVSGSAGDTLRRMIDYENQLHHAYEQRHSKAYSLTVTVNPDAEEAPGLFYYGVDVLIK